MLPFKSLTSSKQLTPEIITQLFSVIDGMALSIESKGRIDLLDDKVVALLFFEPSSRTMMSFQSAAQRLKAGMVFAQNAASTSFEKGESLEDLIRMVESYSDIIVMRHAMPGSADIAANTSKVPFINAGDGGNEHPTQSLIDAYTIYKEKGRLDRLNIVFGYDSLQSRSIHSLSKLLSQYDNNRFTFTGPKVLEPKPELLAELRAEGVECVVNSQVNLHDGYDVAYVNRLQEERFENREIFEENRRKYRLTKADVEGSDCLILDPLPRIDEICTEVDDLANAVYFKQASYGVPVRMALLAMLLGKA
jgi:aspartate carbamoyltransferase catalytic subunit